MKQVLQQKYLPHAPSDVYDLIMDVRSYPALFPMVKSAKMTQTPGGGREVALEFNLPPLVPVKDPVHVARVTGASPTGLRPVASKARSRPWICAGISGPLVMAARI